VVSLTPLPLYSQNSLDRRLGGPQSESGCGGEDKKFSQFTGWTKWRTSGSGKSYASQLPGHIRRQTLEYKNMIEELQTVFQPVMRVVKCVKNSRSRGRFFIKLRDDTEAEHTALLYCCEPLWLS